MARHRIDTQKIAARTTQSAAGMIEKDRVRDDRRNGDNQELYPLRRIAPRVGGDTRRLRPEHIFDLAESIAALGLLEPIVVDARGKLLAGGHRLAACMVLTREPETRGEALAELLSHDFVGSKPSVIDADMTERLQAIDIHPNVGSLDLVPVRVMDFESADDPERALAIEAAENSQRRDYTQAEIRVLYQRLVNAGYSDRRGKPRTGERAAMPAIAVIIGRSVRTVRRMLRTSLPQSRDENLVSRAIDQLVVAIRRLHRVQKLSVLTPEEEALVRLATSDLFMAHIRDAQNVRSNSTPTNDN